MDTLDQAYKWTKSNEKWANLAAELVSHKQLVAPVKTFWLKSVPTACWAEAYLSNRIFEEDALSLFYAAVRPHNDQLFSLEQARKGNLFSREAKQFSVVKTSKHSSYRTERRCFEVRTHEFVL